MGLGGGTGEAERTGGGVAGRAGHGRTPVGSGRDVVLRARRAIRTCSPGHLDAAGPAAPSAAGASAHRRMTTPIMDSAEPTARCARLPRMQTLRRLAGPLALVLLVTACTGTAAPSGSAAPSAAPASISPSPSADPPASVDPNEPVGTDVPPSGGVVGNGPLTVPKPGQLDPRPVKLEELTADVLGRHVQVVATWTSGVEPCYVLDRIVIEKGGRFVARSPSSRAADPATPSASRSPRPSKPQVDLGEARARHVHDRRRRGRRGPDRGDRQLGRPPRPPGRARALRGGAARESGACATIGR